MAEKASFKTEGATNLLITAYRNPSLFPAKTL
ncbi:hypothetical protein PTE_00101 [Photorhabdus khanii NC19]|uniref:Uncharacterized protein n=1 Tax=Photorhabdus khanii NC19 TaxID=1004151 RepID=W3VAU1_9GAMM|nr:hypothetical protein PTE_00101 [Photorhabdus khanii NC19]